MRTLMRNHGSVGRYVEDWWWELLELLEDGWGWARHLAGHADPEWERDRAHLKALLRRSRE